MPKSLTLDALQDAVSGNDAAFRSITALQPAGGQGDKVFPPTYEGGRYASEQRLMDGVEVQCVVLDSVQSQANRMELTLLDAWEADRIPLPVIAVDFTGAGVPGLRRVTSLEAPHRIADAILRDSELDGTPFSKTEYATAWGASRLHDATALYEICPTALVFGTWGSPEKPGGLGARFPRLIVSEIVGYHATVGVKSSSRIDPLGIQRGAAKLYRAQDGGWTLDEKQAAREKGKPAILGKDGKGRPSEANHGNVTPGLDDRSGGVTISEAKQTTVISLPGLRRLRFPVESDGPADIAARTALAALALAAASLVREQGYDLRSRCLLIPTGEPEWELLDATGSKPRTFSLTGDAAATLLREAVEAGRAAGLPGFDLSLTLRPAPNLAELVKRNYELATLEEEE